MLSRRHFFLSAGAVPALAPAFQGALQSVDIPEIPADALRPAAEVPAPFAGAQWKIKYFHDRADSGLILTDLVAPSPGFVLASGVIEGNRRGKPKDLGIVSRDGGATWNEIKLPRGPATLFALDAGHLWLAATGRLYFSSDQGGKWTRLKLPKRMGRVVFTTPRDGWAYGAGKVFYRTADGGRRWTPVPESQELKLTDEFTVYRTMEFHEGRGGVLAGNSRRPQGADGELPAWIAPERAMARRPRPATTAMFTTLDGGASWKSAVTAAFGDVVRLRLGARRSIALFEYGEGFLFPTEVFLDRPASGGISPLFRRKALRVTDMEMTGDGGYLLSVIEPFGRLPGAGLPGRLRILFSPDGKQWFHTPVDYRAQGPHALLASAGDQRFAALTNGMILRLER
ncbi:MAG: hypothetical protein M9913_13855 [Bryobacteraceae bacterium]|nr:hypothetical protein [Solibacteraceae bacterium]MCO5351959.1 hypothetical protein [Bryobacteraceae bacterium]